MSEAKYPGDHFDVVAASEVLEHVADPSAFVREVARILRPGGLLWATTPHGKGISARVLGSRWSVIAPPEHLQLFSARGMKKMLSDAGFSRARVVAKGVNPFELMRKLRSAGDERQAAHNGGGYERVESGYHLNEMLTKSPARKLLKNSANAALGATRLGDSLKVWAVK